MLIAVNFPAVSLIFFGGLMDLLNFQLVDVTDLFNKVFHLDPNSESNNPLNSQFEMMGYSSLYIVQNFGLLCFGIFLPLVAEILAPAVVFICKGHFAFIK